ncbi:L-fuconolactonase [Curtobacterium sp. PhB42]|uniref:amidohydrolase family protein n=1 Tax=unclassified Curtobacterium TaxID=257496 RepID=UPI00104465C1|nr:MULTISPECIES: amidohydrolase family protein [unclassified Curtobacterium]TCU87215.1 L-fuconolactonase [Curtobacterium sp. PhB191]TDW41775.1 L-fuconolactonase [Curtobacterium sp. PhB42]TDW56779.1 L-fuconolactonase [Curtobacterium sp. PhB190]
MIIDAHHHLWDPADRPYPWMDDSVAPIRRRFDVDDLRAATQDTGVTRTIVVQAVHDSDETAWLLEQPRPVAGVVGWVDLTAPDVADRIAAVRALPGGDRLVGIRHLAQDEPDPGWLGRPDVARGVRALAGAGLVFDLLVRAREHSAALALVDAVPDASFVLDHAGKPSIDTGDPAWLGRMADFAARPNVTCKVSGLLTEAGPDWRDRPVGRYAREVVEQFGPERSLFGSDWPVSTLATGYAAVVQRTTDALADLSTTEHDAVFGGTAARIYLVPRTTQT